MQAAELERVYRDEARQIRASLAARIGDVGLAEEAVQDAFVEAIEHWQTTTPPNPAAWLTTTARRKAIDRMRRAKAGEAKLALLAATETEQAEEQDDDLLGMIFACCHPALPREGQIALTLRAVCGLTTQEIAAAFLVTESAMTQRLLRARNALRTAQADVRIPDPDQLGARVAEVLAVVYLVFNEGYLASAGREPARRDLAGQALGLTRLLHYLMPNEPEVLGLLALLLLHESRAPVRFDGWGRIVRLAEQDRSRWDAKLIAEAMRTLGAAFLFRRPGPYQVQAAIAAVHAEADCYEQTDWKQIRVLYEQLYVMTPSPVVLLNRAVATRYVEGAEAALAEIEPLASDLAGYRLFHALRAGLLSCLGRDQEASQATERALALAMNPAERELLTRGLSLLPHVDDGPELYREPALVDARPGLGDLDGLVVRVGLQDRVPADHLFGLDERPVGHGRPADRLCRLGPLQLLAAVRQLAAGAPLLVPGEDLRVPGLPHLLRDLVESRRVHDQHHVLHLLFLLR
jgi:RNA polymerase sigma factor (sigma-70 family)